MISIAELRQLALSLPGVEEHDFWGEPTFRVSLDIFLTLSPSSMSAGVKLPFDERESLLATDTFIFSVGRYSGRFGFVTAQIDPVDAVLMSELVIKAWRRVAPTQMIAKYDLQRGW